MVYRGVEELSLSLTIPTLRQLDLCTPDTRQSGVTPNLCNTVAGVSPEAEDHLVRLVERAGAQLRSHHSVTLRLMGAGLGNLGCASLVGVPAWIGRGRPSANWRDWPIQLSRLSLHLDGTCGLDSTGAQHLARLLTRKPNRRGAFISFVSLRLACCCRGTEATIQETLSCVPIARIVPYELSFF